MHVGRYLEYRGGYSVQWGIFSMVGDIQYHGGFMINVGDILSTVGDIMSTVGDILSTVRDTQYCGEIS